MKLAGKLKNNKGFSLAEVLIVIAIIIILGALGTFSVVNMIENSRQTAADKAAQSIAETIQARLQEIYAFENDSKEALEKAGNNSTSLAVLKEENGASIDGELAASALTALTENGQVINSEFYKNGIAVEIDVSSFRVLSVFYSSDTTKYGINTIYGDSNAKGTPSQRKSAFKGYAGYFGDTDEASALLKLDTDESIIVRVGHFVNGERRLYNYDKLIANVDIKFNTTFDSAISSADPSKKSKIFDRCAIIDMTVKGITSGAKAVYKYKGTYTSTMDAVKNSSFIVDGLNAGERFIEQFGGNEYPENTNLFNMFSRTSASKTGAFIPGEEIEVTVTVSTYLSDTQTSGEPLLTATSSATDNSLFAYDNGIAKTEENNKNVKTGVASSSYTAFITCGRHLQNLDTSSGIVAALTGLGANNISAVQAKDIDFEEIPTVTDAKIIYWKTAYSGKNFTPITNVKVESITGLNVNEATATQKHKISNIKIDELQPASSAIAGRTTAKTNAGLFEDFAGKTISNLNIENPEIKGPLVSTSCVGTVAGKLSDENSTAKVTVTSVIIKDPKIDASHTAKAGGMIGYSECELDAIGCKVNITGADKGYIKTAETP
jgi:prepilin-type N-terminal cleavage/methylation domain-containing protein